MCIQDEKTAFKKRRKRGERREDLCVERGEGCQTGNTLEPWKHTYIVIQGTNTTREIEERETHRQMPTQDSERNTSALLLHFHSDRNICHLPPKILNLETSNWMSHPTGSQTDVSVRQ